MAVTIVGTDSASTAGAASVVIPLPAGTAIGDDVYLQISAVRAAGGNASPTTPSGFFLISTGDAFRLYQKLYTTTPPADVTVTFGFSDVHCLAKSITVRGFLENAGSSWRQISTITGFPITYSPKVLPERITEFADTVVLSFYAAQGNSDSCTRRAGVAASTTNPTTTFAITMGSTTQFGDSLFVQVTSRDHTSGDAYPTVTDNDTDGGNTWTRIAESTDRVATLWWKRATGGTASKTITVAGCIGSAAGGFTSFLGAATSVTPYTNIVVESNASADETHASFTPDFRGSAICLGVFNYGAANAASSESTANLGAMLESWEKLSTGGNDCACVHAYINGTDTAPAATGAITWAQTDGVTHSISWAVRPEPVISANITVPTEQTGLFSTTQAGPPALSFAAGYQTISAANTVVPAQSVVLSGTTVFTAVQVSIVPAESVSQYAAHWETPLGPFTDTSLAGHLIFGTADNYTYHVSGADDFTTLLIRKIVRSTFTVESTTTFTGRTLNYYSAAAQDDTALYMTLLTVTPAANLWLKVLKSDLSEVVTGAAPVVAGNEIDGPSSLWMGTVGTWSEGILWGLCNAPLETLNERLIGWNPTTGAVVHNLGLAETLVGGYAPQNRVNLTVDNNGDVWILGARAANDFPFPGTLTKVTSGPTVGTPLEFPTLYPIDGSDAVSMTYDPINHALIILTSSVLSERPEWSQIARYDITGTTMTYLKNYAGLYGDGSLSLSVKGNGLRDFNSVPSVFRGWHNNFLDAWPATIVQFNHETGVPIRAIEMQSGYDMPHNVVLSPEGDLWMVSGFCTPEYIHRLRLTGDATNGGLLAQGYISWAEMQVPNPAESQGFWIRPTYGRGYGRGYGDSHG